jgi:uncharacterized membrane protein
VALGPIEVAVIGFEGDRFASAIAPALNDVVERGMVRIVDLVFVAKDRDGVVRAFELDDVDGAVADAMSPLTDEVSGLLSEDDVRQIGERLEPGSSAAMVVFEHAWLRRLREAVRDGGGHLVTQERIPPEVVERALAARIG